MSPPAALQPLGGSGVTPPQASRSSQILRWWPALGATVLLWLHSAWYGHLADDAYISFRYARQLAAGQGLVFNRGERVMGFSNPLWTLLLAGGEAVGVAGELFAPVLGALAMALLLGVLWGWAQTGLRSWPSRLLLLGFPVTCGTVALWTTAGLEGPLFGLLLTAAALGVHRAGRGGAHKTGEVGDKVEDVPRNRLLLLGIPLGLAVWTRPEGPLFAGALAFALALRSPTWAGRLRVWPLLVAPVAAYLLQLLLIWGYYGDLVPNTWYAKAHPLSLELLSRGWVYLLKFVRAYHYVPAIALGAWLAVGGWRRDGAGRLALVLLLAFVAFFLVVGGDALVLHRMWAWPLPWLALLAAEALDTAVDRGVRPRLAAAVVLLALAGLGWPSFSSRQLSYLRLDEQVVESGRQLGDRLASLPPSTLLAANTIGAVAYRSQLPLVDMLGLTDAVVAKAPGKQLGVPAHESHAGSYVLDRKPDLIVFGVPFLRATPLDAAQLAATAQYPSDRDLLADPRLANDYQAQPIAVGRQWVTVWARKAWLKPGSRLAL